MREWSNELPSKDSKARKIAGEKRENYHVF